MTHEELIEFVREYTTVDANKEEALTPIDVEDVQLRNEIKQWITALESGEYKQAPEALYGIKENGEFGYCCLGVACSLAGFDDDELNCGDPSAIEKEPLNALTEVLMNSSMNELDLYPIKFEQILIKLNDNSNAGFDFIAKVLRAKYKIYE